VKYFKGCQRREDKQSSGDDDIAAPDGKHSAISSEQ
jgi:hypothetical protein